MWAREMQAIDINQFIDNQYEVELKNELAHARLSRAEELVIDSIELRAKGYSMKEIKALHSEAKW